MTQAIRMVHAQDPKEAIYDAVGEHTDSIHPLAAQVLIAVYKRPEKTAGGIFLSEAQRGEEDYQGKVGLVLKKGPLAFIDDATHRFGDAAPAEGDWVLISTGDTFPFHLGPHRCRIVEDVNVKAILQQPDIAY